MIMNEEGNVYLFLSLSKDVFSIIYINILVYKRYTYDDAPK